VSRGSWFWFLGSALFLSIWIHGLGVFFLILGIAVLILQPLCHPFLKERLRNFFIFSDAGSKDRRFMWQAGWKMFISRPLIGVGLGTFMFNFKKFVASNYPYGIAYAHNCYLQMASEIGVIGLVSFLSILTVFFYQGIKTLKSKEKNFHWHILLASLAGILGYCIQMGVDTILYSLDLGMLFWLVLGLGVAAMRNMDKEPAA
jgi:putative inorganic carbon (HCO3(-)) transporter